MLYDLTSGHVGIELVKPGGTKPVASKTAIDLCKAGVEVTLEDEMLRKQLPEAVKSHGTHVVALPEDDKHGMSADEEDHSTLETKQEEETTKETRNSKNKAPPNQNHERRQKKGHRK